MSRRRPGGRVGAALAALLAAATVGGCGDTWLGSNEDPPLPGERISVLMHEKTLAPDPGTEKTQVLLPQPTPNDSWPQAGGYANHAMHHIRVGDMPRRQWSVDIGTGSDDSEKFLSSPVVAEGKVFAMDAESVVSTFDAHTGKRLWEVALTPEEEEDDGLIGGGVAYEKGLLFATTPFAHVVALDARTGGIVWRKVLPQPMRAAPTVRGGRLFVVDIINKLHALNARTGEELWSHSGIAETASLLGAASPAEDQGVVVVPYTSGELVALRVENGRVLWSESLTAARRTAEVETLAHIRGRPVIDRGIVIAQSHGGMVAAFRLQDGRRIWEREIGGIESPWVAGDYVFTLTTEAELVCLSRKTGTIFWVTKLPQWENPEERLGPIVWTGPLLASDRLIVAGSEGVALALSPYSGEVLGKLEMPDAVSVPPVIAGEWLYFLADDAELVAYH